jgi:outer membrane protein TolC
MAYYDLFLAQKSREIVEKNKNLLQQFAEISEARYKVGRAAQQDVLKAQVEVSRLLDRLAVLDREHETAWVRINTLLYRPPETSIARLPEPSAPEAQRTNRRHRKSRGRRLVIAGLLAALLGLTVYIFRAQLQVLWTPGVSVPHSQAAAVLI